MPAITPAFLFDLESNMKLVTSDAYKKLSTNLWWQRVAKKVSSTSKKERISWLLDTARIERTTKSGGQVTFDDIVSQTTEFENENASGGLKLKKEQLEDLDGNGVHIAANWSRQIGAYSAYWPQKQVARVMLNPGNAYDGEAFFSASHPVNPFLGSGGATYSNLITGKRIDGAVTLDVAVQNIADVLATIADVKMPNGEDPRFLRAAGILHPPALAMRAQQITNAKFIAQAAATGGGSADLEAVVKNFGIGQPVQCDELAAAHGGSDTTYYVVMEDIISDELGALVYQEREPFSVVYHGPMTDAELARSREFQWTTEGRNTTQPGHPFLLIKVTV